MTEPQQPPAGWYPDPQDAAQQRYWDGNAWTGHTAAPVAAGAPPTGAAAVGAPIPTDSAPAWSVPMAGGVAAPSGKKPFFKRRWVWITAAVVVVLVIVGAVASGGSDHSSGLEKKIKSDGQTQLQAAFSQQLPGSNVTVTKVSCVETGSTQQYTCLIHLTVTYQGQTKNFLQNAAATCDNKAEAHCLWHTTNSPQETASQ